MLQLVMWSRRPDGPIQTVVFAAPFTLLFAHHSFTRVNWRGHPFDYLTVLQQHRDALAATPAAWMPWTYRETLAAVTAAA